VRPADALGIAADIRARRVTARAVAAAALERVSRLEFPFRLNDVTSNYLKTLAGQQPEPLATELRQAAAGDESAQRKVAAVSRPSFEAMVRSSAISSGRVFCALSTSWARSSAAAAPPTCCSAPC